MMTFVEKLRRLLDGKNQSELSRRAGFKSATAIAGILNRGVVPRADLALRIAKVLNVDLTWLVDDAQDWPPSHVIQPLNEVSERELQAALARRFRARLQEFCEGLEQLLELEPSYVLNQLYKYSHRSEMPEYWLKMLRSIVLCYTFYEDVFNPFSRMNELGWLPFEQTEEERDKDAKLRIRAIYLQKEFWIGKKYDEEKYDLERICRDLGLGNLTEQESIVHLIPERGEKPFASGRKFPSDPT